VRLRGTVVKGFGRGSKELGVPTANLDPEALGSSLDGVQPGVYFGWASVGASGEVYKMVMSIGWCVCRARGRRGRVATHHRLSDTRRLATTLSHAVPLHPSTPFPTRRNPFYGNKSKTVEPHLLHSFPEDFYGQELRLCVTGYLRPELNFTSLDALIAAIRSDIDTAREELDAEDQKKLVGDAALLPQA
jgi:FAD synthase